MSAVGASIDRIDGPSKVRGEAIYAADVSLPRMTYAILVLSTKPAGRVAIDAREAARMPGVVRVITSTNAIKFAVDEEKPPLRPLSLLQDDVVHYNGQPIAVVVAEQLDQARHAASHLMIRYQADAAVLDFDAAKATAKTPKDANRQPTDLAWGDVDGALERSAVRVDARYTTPSQNHNPMEPHATVAEWVGKKLTVHDATQGVFGCRTTLAKHFSIPEDDVRVLCPFVGGGFGCKGTAWSHVVLSAMAAKLVGRPVKLVLDRTQMFAPVGGRPRTEQHIVLGADAEGHLLAIRHAVMTQSSMLEDWVEASALQTRMLYASESGDTTHRLAKLNIGTPTYQRAPGEASGTFALEVAMDELAQALKLDPVELRLRNHADKSPADGKPFSAKSLRECYRVGAERFGWSRRTAAPRSMKDGQWLVGMGMGTATYPANRSKASALATILADGTALVQAGSQDLGTGTYTVMTQVAADALGLPLGKIRFELGDTRMPETPVSGGSQTSASVSSAVQAACFAAKEKLLAAAVDGEGSPLAGVALENLKTDAGWIVSTETRSRRESFASVIARHGGTPISAKAQSSPDPAAKDKFAFHSFGAAFAEVRVDPDLGIIRLHRLHGTYDIGRRL
ncbi:MAG: xanthine dehydrogenase family protein molybdopterin-binding subunit, partial [Dokdonella sp.]|uniref:xanthine dehydrogenase family protein molybdopterin-binding subunit n=1 Tax=Dokdonella sp. TaxID=2291710 RepID=UPI003265B895